MALDYTKKAKRKIIRLDDLLHVITGTAIVRMMILALTDTEKHKTLFPVILILSGLLDIGEGLHKIITAPVGRKKFGIPVVHILSGLLILGAAAITGMVLIWK